MHKETLVKVNAWVDEGVCDLVSALNELPNVETLDSCEDDAGSARVYFRFRGTPWENLKRVHELAVSLENEDRVGCQYDISVEYRGDCNPIVRIATAPANVKLLAAAVRASVLVARCA